MNAENRAAAAAQMNAENRAAAAAVAAVSSSAVSVTCKKHPRELVVGVCAACLRERLASVNPADRQTKGLAFTDAKIHGKKGAIALQGLQKKKQAVVDGSGSSSGSNGLLGFGVLGPQLRRSKSFSEGRAQARAKIESSAVEPKRKSCDIRVRNTLWALFQIDQEDNNPSNPASIHSNPNSNHSIQQESAAGSSAAAEPGSRFSNAAEKDLLKNPEKKPVAEHNGRVSNAAEKDLTKNPEKKPATTELSGRPSNAAADKDLMKNPEKKPATTEPNGRFCNAAADKDLLKNPEKKLATEFNGRLSNAAAEKDLMKNPEKKPDKSEDHEIEIITDDEEEEDDDAAVVVSDQVTRPVPIVAASCSLSCSSKPHPAEESGRILYDSYEAGESSGNAIRTIKYHIDQDTQCSRNGEANGNADKKGHHHNHNQAESGGDGSKDKSKTFWLTDMVMKRIQKWKKRNREKNRHPQRQKPYPRDARSEVFDDARPSCEDDPRFSIDIGRTSWEDSRHSWDEPRASWDGILIGRLLATAGHDDINHHNYIHNANPNSSLASAVPCSSSMGSSRNYVFAEDENCCESREYYSGRRKKTPVLEKPKSKAEESSRNNTKVTPAILDDENHLKIPLEMHDAYLDKYMENPQSDDPASLKPSRSYKWSKAWSKTISNPMWGFMQKRNCKDEVSYEGSADGDCGQQSDSWREFQRDKDGRRMLRKGDIFSSSSVGSRSAHCSSANNSRPPLSNGAGVIYRSNSNSNAQRSSKNGWQKKREEATLDRSRSVHIAPSNGDNGLLRFYLTPLRSSRRNSTGSARIKPPLSSSRSALWLY